MKNTLKIALVTGIFTFGGIRAADKPAAGEQPLFSKIPSSIDEAEAESLQEISKEWVKNIARSLSCTWSLLDDDARPKSTTDVLNLSPTIKAQTIAELLHGNPAADLIIKVLFANEGIHLD